MAAISTKTNALSDPMTRLQSSSSMNAHGLLMHTVIYGRRLHAGAEHHASQYIILSCVLLSLVIKCLALGDGCLGRMQRSTDHAGGQMQSSTDHGSCQIQSSTRHFGGCMRRITNLGGGRMRSIDLVLVTSVDGEVV